MQTLVLFKKRVLVGSGAAICRPPKVPPPASGVSGGGRYATDQHMSQNPGVLVELADSPAM